MPVSHLKNGWRKFSILRRNLWEAGTGSSRSTWITVLRVIALTYRGIFDNGLFGKAAALSYSSLLALGPIIGIIVLLTGTFMRGNPEVHIKQAILFIAPTMAEYVNLPADDDDPWAGYEEAREAPKTAEDVARLPADQRPNTDPEPLPPQVSDVEVSTALDVLIDRIIEGAKETVGGVQQTGKGIAGAVGGIVLIWIGITLLVAVENASNNIWGVRQGRAWGNRVVFYWAVLSLGALLGFALIGLLSATTVASLFDNIPFGDTLSRGVLLSASFVGLTVLLTLFYKFFPNTHVQLKPALIGSVAVAVLLFLNNLLSILYINRVLTIQNLYGSVGIILVLMFGLYLFWVFLLVGTLITYAVQNVQFLANKRAWKGISRRTWETVTFAAYVLICRRFANCEEPIGADDIAKTLRVPNNVINESLTCLCSLDFIKPTRAIEDQATDHASYLPSRPLSKVTLATFHNRYFREGSNDAVGIVRDVDPLIRRFCEQIDNFENDELNRKSIENLLDQFPQDAPIADNI